MISDISTFSKDFDLDIIEINKIIKIMNNYCYLDLIKAVYCINICVNNRSALESQMKLNLSLYLCDKTGTLEIKKYKEFKNFFNELKPYIKVSSSDDPILEDFSEIKFKFNRKVYNAIIGTGYSSSYAQLYFLEPLALCTNKMKEITDIVKYNSEVIDYFKECNISDNKDHIRIICPSNILFKRVKKYFSEMNFENTSHIYSLVKCNNEYIEKKHFIFYENKNYPLYNTSILIDTFDLYFSNLSEQLKNKIVDNGIYLVLNSLTALDDRETPMVYFPIVLDKGDFNKQPLAFTFMAQTSNNNVIIAINKSEYSKENLEIIIDKLNNDLKDNLLKFIEARSVSSNGYRSLKITNNSNLKFILYDNYVNLSELTQMFGERGKNNILQCNALDVIYMILFSNGFDEIESYIDYNGQDEYVQMIGFGGDSSRFFTWKSGGHMIAKGAIKFSLIDTDINAADGFVLDYYKENIKFFPWNSSNSLLFDTPFSWNIKNYGNGVYLYENKINKFFFGYVKYFNNNQAIFFETNLNFWDEDSINKYDQITSLIDDIILRKLKTCFEYFQKISIKSNKTIYFLFMPRKYAKKVGVNISDINRLVFGDCMENELSLNIRYTINFDLLYKKISESTNRCIENRFVKELFEPIKKYYPEEFEELNEYLDSSSNEKKEIETIQIKLDYIHNNSFRKYYVEDYDYLKAKKIIAEVCKNSNIEPGEYYGIDANFKIRAMQKELIQKFERMICEYDQSDLHIKLLEMYSNSVHDTYIHKKRYSMVDNVTDEVLNEVRNNIIYQCEEFKRNSRTLLYLIESNLYLSRNSLKKIEVKDLRVLLAFSNWLVNLNDTADICYFTDSEAHIIVNYDYVVDNEINDNINNGEYVKRVYSNNNYIIQHDSNDKVYFDNVLSAFNQETGCDLKEIFYICYYLQIEFLKYDYSSLDNNVYKISKESLIKNLYNIINKSGNENYSKLQIEKNLNFLIINPSELKTRNGKKDFFLPFNERKNRNNRFEIKPILLNKNDIIFSPVLMKNVYSLWCDGIMNFILPYEIGLSKTRSMILKWKKKYEDKLVYDIQKIFLANGISFVKINVKIHKIDKSENYPNDIGDFDVIAIDDVNKKMWVIESKFLSLVGSFYERFEQQKNFFKEGKYIEKFQRRIDFMNQNYKRVLKSFGFYDTSNYKVLYFMVFNKIMISRYRDIDIPLISISELEESIKTIH